MHSGRDQSQQSISNQHKCEKCAAQCGLAISFNKSRLFKANNSSVNCQYYIRREAMLNRNFETIVNEISKNMRLRTKWHRAGLLVVYRKRSLLDKQCMASSCQAMHWLFYFLDEVIWLWNELKWPYLRICPFRTFDTNKLPTLSLTDYWQFLDACDWPYFIW